MPARENPSTISLLLLAAGAGVAYYYWKKKKEQHASIGEAQLGLQMIAEQGSVFSMSGMYDEAQSATDVRTQARIEAEHRAAAEAQAAQPQTMGESMADFFLPGISPELR